MKNKKPSNILIGIAALMAGIWFMSFLKERQAEVITERFENRAAALTQKAEESRKVAIQQMEVRKAEADQKKIEAEQEKAEEELALLQAKKRNSPECQFWKLQKKNAPSEKADEKINIYCNIN